MPTLFTRRHFLRQLVGAGAIVTTGLDSLLAARSVGSQSFRFAFLTDLHLLKDGDLRSAQGIATCLGAVEKLSPRPDFILVGGDLVDRARDLTIPEAERRLTMFQQIWRDHTSLPAHWTFGNHDLVGTSNPSDSPGDPRYGKGLFKERFHLHQLFYSFDFKGWHFVVLDDISPQPKQTYIGEFFADELGFLASDLEAHASMPTIICTHIPIVSNIALAYFASQPATSHPHGMRNLVCENGSAVTSNFPRHNVRAVLAGHLHYHEQIMRGGIPFVNSGAVCGSYWKGPVYGCHEGFGVVDLGADGSFDFKYQTYGWKAAQA